MKKYLFVFFTLSFASAEVLLFTKNNPLSKTIDVVKSPKKVVADAHYNPALNFYLDKPVNKFAANQIDSRNTLTPGTIILSCLIRFNQLDSLDFKLLAREQDIFEGRETLIFLK